MFVNYKTVIIPNFYLYYDIFLYFFVTFHKKILKFVKNWSYKFTFLGLFLYRFILR